MRLPLSSSPALRTWCVIGRGRAAAMSSSRVRMSLTGFLTMLAITAACTGSIRPDAPAEAAAQQLQIDLDLVRRGLEHAGDHRGRERLHLRADPDLRRLAVLGDLGDGVHRLHLGVVGVLRPVGRFHHLGGAGERLVGVADLVPFLRLDVGVLALAGRIPPSPFRSRTARPRAPTCPTSTLSALRPARVASTVSPTTATPNGSGMTASRP